MIRIIWGPPGRRPTNEAEIDGSTLTYNRSRGRLEYPDKQALIALFGDGFAEQGFHIITEDGAMLENCQIVRSDGGITFEIDRVVDATPDV